MSHDQQQFRRIVTGHDASGKAIIVSDGPPPRVHLVGGPGGATFTEVWSTRESPALIDRQSGEPPESGLVLGPPEGGTRIRVIDFPPENDAVRSLGIAQAATTFAEMGDAEASRAQAGAPLEIQP